MAIIIEGGKLNLAPEFLGDGDSCHAAVAETIGEGLTVAVSAHYGLINEGIFFTRNKPRLVANASVFDRGVEVLCRRVYLSPYVATDRFVSLKGLGFDLGPWKVRVSIHHSSDDAKVPISVKPRRLLITID